MALRMAQPWTNRKSRIIYLRQRTPKDLLHLIGQEVSLPVGGSARSAKIGPLVQLSLRTKDPVEAKERHALADAALRRFWQRKRRGLNAAQDSGLNAPAGPAPTMEWNTAVARFGDVAAALLAESGQPNSDAHRATIVAETAQIYDAVAAMFGPKFGAGLVGPRNATTTVDGSRTAARPSSLEVPLTVTVKALWDSFSTAKKDVLAPKSMSRYAPSLLSLATFCGDRDIRKITGDDIFRWAEHRRDVDKNLSRVINRNDLVAVKSVFGWAVTHQGGKLLATNPAEGIRLDEPRYLPTRERKFREAEITAILKAALDEKPDPRDPAHSRAKRWCPWLSAYTGARIAELTALRAEDIWQEHGVWVMHFSTTKNRLPRMVPIHEHLIEQGFLAMRNAVGSGPLFYDPARRRKIDAATSPWENCAKKIATWVREIAQLDRGVDPTHGWRHTFKSRATGLIDVRIRDHITGHSEGSVGRKYEHPEIIRIAEALARFPRYEL